MTGTIRIQFGVGGLFPKLKKQYPRFNGSSNSAFYTSSRKLYSTLTNRKLSLAERYHGIDKNVWLNILPSGAATDIINLGVGSADYNPAPEVVQYLAEVSKFDGNHADHQYTGIYGHGRLVNALAKLYGSLIQRDMDPAKEVLVTPGASAALSYALLGHVNPGDEVILIEPIFDIYSALVQVAGGTAVYVPLRPENPGRSNSSADWKIDIAELKSRFNSRTKAIIVNTPHNPIGKVFTKEELTEIGQLCREHDVLIIADEVYEWLVHDGLNHVRFNTLEDFWNRTITIGSAGKTFGLTGWKLGWAYGPAHLLRNMRVAHDNFCFVTHTPVQAALGVAMEVEAERLGTPESFFRRMQLELERKRGKIVTSLREAGLDPILPQGGYFCTTKWNCPGLKIDLSKESEELKDFQFMRWLAREKRILGLPPSIFYSEQHKHMASDYMRLNFYKKDGTLDKAAAAFRTLK